MVREHVGVGRGPLRPQLRKQRVGRIVTDHPILGSLEIVADEQPALLFCDNETNAQRLFGAPSASPSPKDGINDHVVNGAETVASKAGTKAAFWYVLELGPGETAALRIRLRPADREHEDPWTDFDEESAARRGEADESSPS